MAQAYLYTMHTRTALVGLTFIERPHTHVGRCCRNLLKEKKPEYELFLTFRILHTRTYYTHCTANVKKTPTDRTRNGYF